MANDLKPEYQELIWDWTWERLKVNRLKDIEVRFGKVYTDWTMHARRKLATAQGTSPDIPIYTGSLGKVTALIDTELLELHDAVDILIDLANPDGSAHGGTPWTRLDPGGVPLGYIKEKVGGEPLNLYIDEPIVFVDAANQNLSDFQNIISTVDWTDDNTAVSALAIKQDLDINYLRLDATNDPMQARLSMGDYGMDDVNDIILSFIPTGITNEAAQLYWNHPELSLNVATGSGPILQVGQELYILIYNDSGGDYNNGEVMRPVGIHDFIGLKIPTIERAHADIFSGVEGTLMMLTMDVPDGTVGLATKFGKVRHWDTSHLTPGATAYISPTIPGTVTNTRPEFPDYEISLGAAFSSAVDGTFIMSVSRDLSDTFNNFWNGVFREGFSLSVTETGGVVTGTVVPKGSNPDMTMIFSDGFSMFDTSPSATITLAPGTDTNPQTNYVYILQSTKALTTATSDWPATEHIKLAQILLKSATATGLEGALRNQNWNDHIQSASNNMGHLSHITEKLRQFDAQWKTGVEGILTVDSAPTPDDVWVSTTGGTTFQLHRQAFPPFDTSTGDIMYIVNHPTTPYITTSNLNTQLLYSDGSSLNNASFSFVLWGVQNSGTEPCHLMINLPSDGYGYTVPDTAVQDPSGYANYSMPTSFHGVGFLIARFTMLYKNNVWTLYETEDLRGRLPNTSAGGGSGGGGGVTTFTALTDTPSTYTAFGGYATMVNSGATALEFINLDTLGYVSGRGNGLGGQITYWHDSVEVTGDVGLIYNEDYIQLTEGTGGGISYWGQVNTATGEHGIQSVGKIIATYTDTLDQYNYANGELLFDDTLNTLKIGAYTIPAIDGTSNQVLSTNGLGIVSWTTPSVSNIESGTTNGQMLFWDTDSWKHTEVSELVWDDTNKRLGIGATSPNTLLDVQGTLGLLNSATVAVDTIETTLTDDDTHLPTSGAVYGAVSITDKQIAVGTGTGITGNSNFTWDDATGILEVDHITLPLITGTIQLGQGFVAGYSGLYDNTDSSLIAGMDNFGNYRYGSAGAFGTDGGLWISGSAAQFGGSLLLNTIPHETLDVDKFLVSNGGLIKYRTGAELLSDIGGSGGGSGTVTSVAQSVPTGFSIAGSPITTSGTLAITFASGYSLPTDLRQATWDDAFNWGDHSLVGYLDGFTTGNSTYISLADIGSATHPNITASLSASGVGSSATFLRGDNTWSVPAGLGGTVTEVRDGNGMEFVTITGVGDVTMGTPSSLTGTTTNLTAESTHTHEVATGVVADASTDLVDSNAVYDFVTGEGYLVSPLTTKGDIHTYDTGDQRLGVGTNDYVLTADSTTSTGLKWATAGSGTSYWDRTSTVLSPATSGDVINNGTTKTDAALNILSSGFPVGSFIRTTSATGGSIAGTSGIASGYSLRTVSSGNMTDGFGGGIIFSAEDATSGGSMLTGIMARLYARRDGGDSNGLFQIFTTGTSATAPTATFFNSGNVSIGNTADTHKLRVGGEGYFSGDLTTTADLIASQAIWRPNYRHSSTNTTQLVTDDLVILYNSGTGTVNLTLLAAGSTYDGLEVRVKAIITGSGSIGVSGNIDRAAITYGLLNNESVHLRCGTDPVLASYTWYVIGK